MKKLESGANIDWGTAEALGKFSFIKFFITVKKIILKRQHVPPSTNGDCSLAHVPYTSGICMIIVFVLGYLISGTKGIFYLFGIAIEMQTFRTIGE